MRSDIFDFEIPAAQSYSLRKEWGNINGICSLSLVSVCTLQANRSSRDLIQAFSQDGSPTTFGQSCKIIRPHAGYQDLNSKFFSTGLILAPVLNEFHNQGPFLKLAQNIGLLIGAFFWGLGSDVWGRRCAQPLENTETNLIDVRFTYIDGVSTSHSSLPACSALWRVPARISRPFLRLPLVGASA